MNYTPALGQPQALLCTLNLTRQRVMNYAIKMQTLVFQKVNADLGVTSPYQFQGVNADLSVTSPYQFQGVNAEPDFSVTSPYHSRG